MTAPCWRCGLAPGAVVRKPPGKEPARDWAWAAVPRYGDFAGAGRAFASGCGGAAATWPLVARAQQGNPVRRIGVG
jgi:hypothetical protein